MTCRTNSPLRSLVAGAALLACASTAIASTSPLAVSYPAGSEHLTAPSKLLAKPNIQMSQPTLPLTFKHAMSLPEVCKTMNDLSVPEHVQKQLFGAQIMADCLRARPEPKQ